MKELLKFIETFNITEITHSVDQENGQTELFLHTNYGYAKINTFNTKTSDLKFILPNIDSSDIDISEIDIDFNEIIKNFLYTKLCKKTEEIKQFNNDY